MSAMSSPVAMDVEHPLATQASMLTISRGLQAAAQGVGQLRQKSAQFEQPAGLWPQQLAYQAPQQVVYQAPQQSPYLELPPAGVSSEAFRLQPGTSYTMQV